MKNRTDLRNHLVSIIHDKEIAYPAPPYAPADNYPELKFLKLNEDNNLYLKIRELLFNLNLDKENFGTEKWNPLEKLIVPGQTVLIKPNWVRDYNPIDESIESLITHASVVRPFIDYCLIALKGSGKIIIADAPVQDCDFENILQVSGISELIKNLKEDHPKIEFQIVDLRKTVLKRSNSKGLLTGKEYQIESEGDPLGYSLIDMGQESTLTDTDKYYKKYRITCYDHRLLEKHHNPTKHEYYISNSVLNADAIINIPKLKTHVKAGLTGSLKNFIGANGHKEYLPHHMNGCPKDGGDQYIHKSLIKIVYNKIYDHYWSMLNTQNKTINKLEFELLRYLYGISARLDKDNLFEGNWYGNKTVPRTTLDINKILYFYNLKNKSFEKYPVRKILHIIDGIVAGEGHGPLQPTAKKAGILIGGFNPILIDSVIGKLMGYNITKIKTLSFGLSHKKLDFICKKTRIEKSEVIYNGRIILLKNLPNLNFIKPKYWQDVSY